MANLRTTGKTLYKNLNEWDFDRFGSYKIEKQDYDSALKAFKMLADEEERQRKEKTIEANN